MNTRPLAWLALLAVLALTPGFLLASAQGGLYLNVGQANATYVAETSFYRLVVNASTGVPANYYAKDQSGAPHDISGYPAGPMILYAEEGDASPRIVEWANITIVEFSNTTKMIILSEPVNAPSNLSVRLVMYSYYPFIDVIVDPAPGYISIAFPLNNTAAAWNASIAYYDGARLLAALVNVNESVAIPGDLDAMAVLGYVDEGNSTVLKYMVAFYKIPGYSRPILAGLYTLEGVEGPVAALTYYFQEGVPGRIGVRLTGASYASFTVAASMAVNAVAAQYPGVVDDIRSLAYYETLVERLNQTITSLEEQVNRLAEENANLTKKLKEYEGCEKVWKSELNVLKRQCDAMREAVQSAGLRVVAAFAGGVLLGVVGGIIAVEKTTVRVRRR